MSDRTYELLIAPTARGQLTQQLPEPVALAAYKSIIGPLLENEPPSSRQATAPTTGRPA